MKKQLLAGLTLAVMLGGFMACSVDPESNVYLVLDKTTLSVKENGSGTITATVKPAGKTVTWTSLNTGVATVSGGVVTAVAIGSTTVTASITNNGETATESCTVNVLEDIDQYLTAHYTFDTVASTTMANEVTSFGIADLALTAYSASSSTSTSYCWTPAKVGTGSIYWPNSNSGGTISGAVVPSTATAVTISAWVNRVTLQWINFVNFTDGTVNERFDLPNLTLNTYGNDYAGFSSDDVVSPFTNDAVFYYSGSYADANGWVFLTLVIDSTANTISYYCNGALLITYASTSLATDIDATMAIANGTTSGGMAKFGFQNWSDGASVIDDLRIYDVAFDASQVSLLYNEY